MLLTGLVTGLLYALIALGYTMVYGIIELINFAHGDLFMLGAFLALTLVVAMGLTDASPVGLGELRLGEEATVPPSVPPWPKQAGGDLLLDLHAGQPVGAIGPLVTKLDAADVARLSRRFGGQ